MGNKKIGLGLMLNLIGAMFAYLIGSGFASGQETMQYFSGGENNDEQSESGFRKSTEWITEPEQNLMDE